MKGKCRWIYRPGTYGSHWAHPECTIGGYLVYLSKVPVETNQTVGCADMYNNKQCPNCRRSISMDYGLIKEE